MRERTPRGNRSLADERAFLPALLALIDSPAHPAPLWLMRVIVALTLCAATLAGVGHLDIVVSARGVLASASGVTIVQAPRAGIVADVHVREGEQVAAGQLLMTLRAERARIALDEASAHAIDAALAVARARALLAAQRRGTRPVLDGVALASSAQRSAALQYARAQYDDYRAAVRQAAARERACGDRREAARNRLRGEADVDALRARFRREQHAALDAALRQWRQSSFARQAAQARLSRAQLRAPAAGTIARLAPQRGSIVSAGEALLDIVPEGPLVVQAYLDGKDIGFIVPGQSVSIKLDAYPYTRHGALAGSVAAVSPLARPFPPQSPSAPPAPSLMASATDRAAVDVARSAPLAPAFVTRIALDTTRLRETVLTLVPGMGVTAEIQTGRRSIARYFLDPLLQAAQQSLRER